MKNRILFSFTSWGKFSAFFEIFFLVTVVVSIIISIFTLLVSLIVGKLLLDYHIPVVAAVVGIILSRLSYSSLGSLLLWKGFPVHPSEKIIAKIEKRIQRIAKDAEDYVEYRHERKNLEELLSEIRNQKTTMAS